LEEDRPRFDWDEFLEGVHVIWAVANVVSADFVGKTMGRKPGPENLEAVTWACYEDGQRYSAVDLLNSMAHGNTISRKVGAFFENYDLQVTPTLAQPPARHGEINQDRKGMSAMEWTRQVFAYCPFTPLFNTTGQPAISLPLHWAANGLPIGVQIAGRLGDEATLIRVASQLEEAAPWKDRKPPLHASA